MRVFIPILSIVTVLFTAGCSDEDSPTEPITEDVYTSVWVTDMDDNPLNSARINYKGYRNDRPGYSSRMSKTTDRDGYAALTNAIPNSDIWVTRLNYQPMREGLEANKTYKIDKAETQFMLIEEIRTGLKGIYNGLVVTEGYDRELIIYEIEGDRLVQLALPDDLPTGDVNSVMGFDDQIWLLWEDGDIIALDVGDRQNIVMKNRYFLPGRFFFRGVSDSILIVRGYENYASEVTFIVYEYNADELDWKYNIAIGESYDRSRLIGNRLFVAVTNGMTCYDLSGDDSSTVVMQRGYNISSVRDSFINDSLFVVKRFVNEYDNLYFYDVYDISNPADPVIIHEIVVPGEIHYFANMNSIFIEPLHYSGTDYYSRSDTSQTFEKTGFMHTEVDEAMHPYYLLNYEIWKLE